MLLFNKILFSVFLSLPFFDNFVKFEHFDLFQVGIERQPYSIFSLILQLTAECMNLSRQPLNPLDRNRYLYDEPTTREPSIGSYSKISEIQYEKYADMVRSGVTKQAEAQQNKQNIPWQDKKYLKEFGRELNYKVLTENTEDEENTSAAHKFLLLMMENERLRLQLGQHQCEVDRTKREAEEAAREKARLGDSLRNSQQNEVELREQLRLRELKIEETFDSIKRLYERNNELNAELSAARKELTLNKSRTISDLEVLTSRKELTELKTKLIQLESQQNTLRVKAAGEKQELSLRLIEVEQKSIRRQEEFTVQINQLEDVNVSLKFQISKLKAEINMKQTKEKEIHTDLSRTEEILRNRENQLKEESRRWFKKVQDLEVQKTTLLHNLLKNSQEKESLVDELRTTSQSLKTKESQYLEFTKSKETEIELLKKKHRTLQEQHTTELNCKIERISSLQNLMEKQRNSWNTQKQQLLKNITTFKKQIQDLKQSVSTYESQRNLNSSDQILITKLRVQNGSLKDQISDQYKSILMFENKVRAYENRISILQSVQNQNQHQQHQQQHQQASTCTFADPNISIDSNAPARQYRPKSKVQQKKEQPERYRKTHERQRQRERDRYHSVDYEKKRLLNHYPSSGLISEHDYDRRQTEQDWRRRYASRDRLPETQHMLIQCSPIYKPRPMTPLLQPQRIREQHINVSLPQRRDRLILHSNEQERKETLNDVIVRKCKILG